jgi:hypothetical protein
MMRSYLKQTNKKWGQEVWFKWENTSLRCKRPWGYSPLPPTTNENHKEISHCILWENSPRIKQNSKLKGAENSICWKAERGWGYGPRHRAPAQQVQSPEFKPQYHQKKHTGGTNKIWGGLEQRQKEKGRGMGRGTKEKRGVTMTTVLWMHAWECWNETLF